MEFGKGSPSYYDVLGVSNVSSDEQIRRAYRKLAMQWHPDKWSRTPSLLGKAKQKFQEIQEAYSVLSDGRKRQLYDAGLYDTYEEEDEVEGFSDFVQEMVSLMNDARKEEKNCSIEELQNMLSEMAQGFDIPADCCSSTNSSGNYLDELPPYESQQFFSVPFNNLWENTNSWEATMYPNVPKSNFESYATRHFCR
ncbi:hypothetical protein ACJIZ3_019603 [Penstemon smallii]|uniref:J domain-containing protein n=1 Tax=Penstemon smallii TaxID=265156 RepID=A0ABD3T2G5_9LAMI